MKFLVVNFNNGLGNTVLLNSSFRLIKDKIKNSKITVLSNNRDNDLDISDINLDVSETVNFNKITLKQKIIFLRKIFFGYYDYIFFSPFSFLNIYFFSLLFIFGRSVILIPIYYRNLNTPLRSKFFKFLKIARRIFNSKKELYGDAIGIKCHEIDANLNLIKKILPKEDHVSEKYHLNSIKVDISEKYLKKFNLLINKFICIQYGASHGSLTPKIWSEEKITSLIDLLSQNSKVVILGNSKDRNSNYDFQNKSNVCNLIGKTSMTELVALLKFSNSNICFDSGIMHLSDALNSKLIAIFGPTNIKKNIPRNRNSHVIFKSLSCSPCIKGWNFDPEYISEKEAYYACKNNFSCMNSISNKEILELI